MNKESLTRRQKLKVNELEEIITVGIDEGRIPAMIKVAGEAIEEEMDGNFKVKSVQREDLKEFMDDKKVENLSNRQMREIANRISDGLDGYYMDTIRFLAYNGYIDEVIEDYN